MYLEPAEICPWENTFSLNSVNQRINNSGFSFPSRTRSLVSKEHTFSLVVFESVGISFLKRPQNSKQLKTFLGMLHFYWDMFPKHSHLLAPLNKLASMKGKDWIGEQLSRRNLNWQRRCWQNRLLWYFLTLKSHQSIHWCQWPTTRSNSCVRWETTWILYSENQFRSTKLHRWQEGVAGNYWRIQGIWGNG